MKGQFSRALHKLRDFILMVSGSFFSTTQAYTNCDSGENAPSASKDIVLVLHDTEDTIPAHMVHHDQHLVLLQLSTRETAQQKSGFKSCFPELSMLLDNL